MRRDLRQASFADGLVNQRAGRNSWLDQIDQLLDWPALVKLLDRIYASDEGRPSYPLLTYVKLLLLQQWYGLSDPGLEQAVDDRLSFRRFAGLPLDEGSEIIRTALLTAADLHDSQPAAALICGDEQAVYGDKAYASQALRTKLVEAGINDRLMYRAARNKPLKPWQTWFNKAVASIRAAVERRFAIMKRHYGHRRVRYIGLVRNACHLHLLCTAINLKRALALVG